MYPLKITKSWIKDNFNLNDERKRLDSLKLIDDLENMLDLSPDKEYSSSDFVSRINNVFAVMGVDVVKFSFGGEYNLYEKTKRLETNDEVIERLRVAVFNQRKCEDTERKERAEYERLKGIYDV